MKHLLTTSVSVLLLVSCGQRQGNPIPRQEAYPRIETRQPQYQAVDGLPLVFMANRAEVDTVLIEEQPQGLWVTLPYPRLAAKTYLTFTPVTSDNLATATSNRLERMALNFGTSPVDAEQFETPSGHLCTVATALSPVSTPVQFLAIPGSGDGYLVSGSVFVERDTLQPERDADIINILTRDLNTALNALADH